MSSCAATRARRVKEGKCAVCLQRRASPGHPTCATCREHIAETSRARYEERRAMGMCARSSCDQPATGYLCEDHAAERRARRAKS